MCLLMESNNNVNNNNHHNHKAKMSLVLSTDAKPRLKWTCDLHHRFIEAVNQLGGPNKATPKGLMKVMEIPELTLYHLKSHLQKYRLGKSMKFDDNKLEAVSSASENQEAESKNDSRNLRGSVTEENSNPANDRGLQITEALQMQMEVQKKLHEQIEVQRHLQVKIEAQGKYLQSVLIKAQQTLAGYTSSTLGMDFARTELSRLASMVNRGCPSSSFSELTQVEEEEEVEEGFLWCKKPENRGVRQLRCSVESSLTSSESSETKLDDNNHERKSIELPLMETKSEVMKGKKRSLNDVVYMEQQPLMKKAFGVVDDDEHLRLSLNSYKKDMETTIGLGFN
ncbi:Myb family transcription factor PHL8 [Cardamine amara subsp. amara]|uniref:Myb family transcription factor PHL8 n=1 Tax=Cardamine amara subsp. amara TaxID=228776 RepID=A0ABD1BFR8_CARAN